MGGFLTDNIKDTMAVVGTAAGIIIPLYIAKKNAKNAPSSTLVVNSQNDNTGFGKPDPLSIFKTYWKDDRGFFKTAVKMGITIWVVGFLVAVIVLQNSHWPRYKDICILKNSCFMTAFLLFCRSLGENPVNKSYLYKTRIIFFSVVLMVFIYSLVADWSLNETNIFYIDLNSLIIVFFVYSVFGIYYLIKLIWKL